MKNHEGIMEKLLRYEPDELFYRGYYEASGPGEKRKYLEENPPQDPVWQEHVLQPEKIRADMTEEMFFTENRNVTVIKHPRYLPQFRHKHIFFEMLYVVSGRCRQIFADRTLELNEGDCCLVAPGVSHAISVFDDSVVLNILIRRSTFLDIFLNSVRSGSRISLFFLETLYDRKKTRYLAYRTDNDPLLKGYILEIVNEQSLQDEFSDRIICSLLVIFFNQLTRRYGDTVQTSENQVRRNEQSDEILNYIMNNFDSISIRSLADHFHFTEPYCSKLIKDMYGVTFSDLLTGIRMRRSENLLIHTQLSVEEISAHIGYKNPESFIRCFKKIYKVSPSQYRHDPESASVA